MNQVSSQSPIQSKPSLVDTLVGFGTATAVNFPFWSATVKAQAGYNFHGMTVKEKLMNAMKGPYRGFGATMVSATTARASIIFLSEKGAVALKDKGCSPRTANTVSSASSAVAVSMATHPVLRSVVLLQDPNSPQKTMGQSFRSIIEREGASGLWVGSGVHALRSIPKYTVAFTVKNYLDETLPNGPNDEQTSGKMLAKSLGAGVSSAAVSNPLDVIRNVKMQPDFASKPYHAVVSDLFEKEGLAFMARGLGRNMISVGMPMAIGFYITDLIHQVRTS